MGATIRTAGGRFGSAYHPLELYGVVRAVAEVALPEEPTRVAEAAWDAARAAAGYPDAPSARAICVRLAGDAGEPYAWRELLELVFDDERNLELTHALRQGASADDDLTEEDIYYALRRVAHLELKQASLRPDEYRRERERLIAQERRRRNRSALLLAGLLPTVGQVERIAGDWDRALVIAELEPRQTPMKNGHSGQSVPIAEVLDRFADEAGGWLCRRAQLLQYTRDRKIVMAARTPGSRWEEYVAEAMARREARGALTRGLPPAGTFPAYPGMGEGPGAGADGTELVKPTDNPRDHWTLANCVKAVRTYFDDLTETGNPSLARYRAWAVGRRDAPSPSTFGRYGGWTVVSRLARLRGPLPSELHMPTRREEIEAAVLAHLDEHGQIKNADVQALLGVGEDKARRTLNRLRDRGVIELGSKAATGRSVYYVRSPKR